MSGIGYGANSPNEPERACPRRSGLRVSNSQWCGVEDCEMDFRSPQRVEHPRSDSPQTHPRSSAVQSRPLPHGYFSRKNCEPALGSVTRFVPFSTTGGVVTGNQLPGVAPTAAADSC